MTEETIRNAVAEAADGDFAAYCAALDMLEESGRIEERSQLASWHWITAEERKRIAKAIRKETARPPGSVNVSRMKDRPSLPYYPFDTGFCLLTWPLGQATWDTESDTLLRDLQVINTICGGWWAIESVLPWRDGGPYFVMALVSPLDGVDVIATEDMVYWPHQFLAYMRHWGATIPPEIEKQVMNLEF